MSETGSDDTGMSADKRRPPPQGLMARLSSFLSTAISAHDSEAEGEVSLRRQIWPTRLERLQASEELTWREDSKELRALLWLLRLKHEEAWVLGGSARTHGLLLSVAGVAAAGAAVSIVGAGWWRFAEIVRMHVVEQRTLPGNLWELLLATSGAAILLSGVATGLFAASQRHYSRGAKYDEEMAQIGATEIAVRLLVTAKNGSLPVEIVQQLHPISSTLQRAPTVVPVNPPPPENDFPSLKLAQDLIEQATSTLGKAAEGVRQVREVLGPSK